MRYFSPLFLCVFAAVLGVGLFFCGTARPADVERPEGRWEFFGPSITGAFVGRGGKCFYTTRGKPAEKLSVSEQGIVAPGFRPLLLDRAGRLWCLKLGANAIHGIKGESIITVEPLEGAFQDHREFRLLFGSACEDSAGRIWFGTSRGVQWFDGKKWSSKDLGDRNGLELRRPMTPLRFAEDEAGRMLFWTWARVRGVCGTEGFWSFDGKTWSHYTTRDLLPSDDVRAVCPVGGNVILVNTAGGRLVTFDIGPSDVAGEVARLVGLLNDEQWKVRERATADLKKLGRKAALDLKRHLTDTDHPEVRSRIKLVLDALNKPEQKQQPLPGGRYLYERVRIGQVSIRPPQRRRRPKGSPEWIADATNVTDTKTGKKFARGTFVLSAGSTRLIDDWPVRDNMHLTSALPDGKGGLWIGVADRGLFHWNGKKTSRVSTNATRSYWIVLGRDELGRVLLSSGSRVAAYRPGEPGRRQERI